METGTEDVGSNFFLQIFQYFQSYTLLLQNLRNFISKLDYDGAHNFCCSLGMTLTTVDILDKLNCLTRMVDIFPLASEKNQIINTDIMLPPF
jgi:DNA-directed RNA polymerase subunit N (RpoN/RPB10)